MQKYTWTKCTLLRLISLRHKEPSDTCDIFGKVISQRPKTKTVTPHERPWYNTRSTADTDTKVVVSWSHAALWCFVRRMLLSCGAHKGGAALYAWPPLPLSAHVWVSRKRMPLQHVHFPSNLGEQAAWRVVDKLIRLSGVCSVFGGWCGHLHPPPAPDSQTYCENGLGYEVEVIKQESFECIMGSYQASTRCSQIPRYPDIQILLSSSADKEGELERWHTGVHSCLPSSEGFSFYLWLESLTHTSVRFHLRELVDLI